MQILTHSPFRSLSLTLSRIHTLYSILALVQYITLSTLTSTFSWSKFNISPAICQKSYINTFTIDSNCHTFSLSLSISLPFSLASNDTVILVIINFISNNYFVKCVIIFKNFVCMCTSISNMVTIVIKSNKTEIKLKFMYKTNRNYKYA